jgi:hypothetical protein
MSPPRYTHYELDLEGDPDIIAFLADHLPDRFDTIREANEPRRAIAILFGGKVEAKLVSVRKVPARTRRRVLRV